MVLLSKPTKIKLSRINEFLLIELLLTLIFSTQQVVIMLIRIYGVKLELFIVPWLFVVAVVEIAAVGYSIMINRRQHHQQNDYSHFIDFNPVIAALRSVYLLKYKGNDGRTYKIRKPYRSLITVSFLSHVIYITFKAIFYFGTSHLVGLLVGIAVSSSFVQFGYMLLLFLLSKLLHEQL